MGVGSKKMSVCSVPSSAELTAISGPPRSQAGGPDGAGDNATLLPPLTVLQG